MLAAFLLLLHGCASVVMAGSRGYLTTPAELSAIKQKSDAGLEPQKSSVAAVLSVASRDWNFTLRSNETCSNADQPAWNDNGGGTAIVYAKALAYHLTGELSHARAVRTVLERIMTEVKTIRVEDAQCALNFGWGAPELVASADLIEDYWRGKSCTGPKGPTYGEPTIGRGACKVLFQNWLVKNPYYVVSRAGYSGSN